MNLKDIDTFLAALLPVVKKYIDGEIGARAAETEARTAQLKYCGTFEAGREYKRGNFVTDGGSVWHCNLDTTTTRPGLGDAWTLAVKRGSDGRDAR